MKRKNTLLTLTLILSIALAISGLIMIRKKNTSETIRYTDDYSEEYKHQLQIIFGKDYLISEKETVIIEGEDCSCGYHVDSQEYNEWKISYQDQNGQTFTQTLNNKDSLESQQLSWLNIQLKQYYKQKYLMDFFDEGTFEGLSIESDGRTYCFVEIGNPVNSYSSGQKKEFDKTQEAGRKYEKELLKQLQTEENLLHLSEADYENIFSCFPIYLSFHLKINNGALNGAQKTDFEKRVHENVIEMIQAIKHETHNTCNLAIHVCSADGQEFYDGSKDWPYYILQGEHINGDDFKWQLFYALEGIYW